MDQFGFSVAVAGDTVVVGAVSEVRQRDGGATARRTRAPAVPARPTSSCAAVRRWSQQAYLKASQVSADDQFGRSVAVAGDTVVVGAIDEDGSATGVNGTANEDASLNAGAAYVFVRSGTNWSQQAYLKASAGLARVTVSAGRWPSRATRWWSGHPLRTAARRG
ncbi:MAG: hypothetical protein V9H26_23055 [Verrucomicrobiota bacterium]